MIKVMFNVEKKRRFLSIKLPCMSVLIIKLRFVKSRLRSCHIRWFGHYVTAATLVCIHVRLFFVLFYESALNFFY